MPIDLEPYREQCRRHADILTTQEQRDSFSLLVFNLQRVANTGSREDMQTACSYAVACIDYANKRGA